MGSRAVLLTLALTVVASPALAQDTDSTLQVPAPQGYVTDFAHNLSDTTIEKLDHLIREVQAKSGGEIAVVTLESLRGRPVRSVARGIGRQWGVGRAGSPDDPTTNTGVVLLLVLSDDQGALELGTGTSAFFADSTAQRILFRQLAPLLRAGHVDEAVLLAVREVGAVFARRFGFELTARESQ